MLDLLRGRGVKRFILVGHSMGGKIAWAIAGRRPAGLCGIVLVAPSPPSPEPISPADRHERLDSFGNAEAAAALAGCISGASLPSAALAHFEADSQTTTREAWDGWLLQGSREGLTELTPSPELLALVLSGSSDTAIPTATVEAEVVGRLPRARLQIVPGAGHLLPYETPAALAEAIRSFCEQAGWRRNNQKSFHESSIPARRATAGRLSWTRGSGGDVVNGRIDVVGARKGEIEALIVRADRGAAGPLIAPGHAGFGFSMGRNGRGQADALRPARAASADPAGRERRPLPPAPQRGVPLVGTRPGKQHQAGAEAVQPQT